MILTDDEPPSPAKARQELAETARITEPTQEPSPPPYTAPYPSYQREFPQQQAGPSTVPLLSQTVPDISRARSRAARRFFLALLWAIVIYFLSLVFIESVVELSRPRHGKWFREVINDPQDSSKPAWPKPADGSIHKCSSNSPPWMNAGLNTATFELPSSADTLYLFSRGALGKGIVSYQVDPTLANDIVRVTIIVTHRSSETAGVVTLCSLERVPGERGIGIFTPEKWYDESSTLIEFTVAVSFPASKNGVPTHIKAFESCLPRFNQVVHDMQQQVYFDTLSLHSVNSPITVDGISSRKATMSTINANIVGNYTTYSELSIVTLNGIIAAFVDLHNEDPQVPTKLQMSTTNGALSSHVNLISHSVVGFGGAFSVNAHTTNGPVIVNFPESPSSAQLDVKAITTNSPATVKVNPHYEGAFTLQTTASSTRYLHYDDKQKDPLGIGRERVVHVDRQVRNVMEGWMTWGDNEEARIRGSVSVKTTHGPVSLVVLE